MLFVLNENTSKIKIDDDTNDQWLNNCTKNN